MGCWRIFVFNGSNRSAFRNLISRSKESQIDPIISMIKVSLLTAYYFSSSHPFPPKIETKGGILKTRHLSTSWYASTSNYDTSKVYYVVADKINVFTLSCSYHYRLQGTIAHWESSTIQCKTRIKLQLTTEIKDQNLKFETLLVSALFLLHIISQYQWIAYCKSSTLCWLDSIYQISTKVILYYYGHCWRHTWRKKIILCVLVLIVVIITVIIVIIVVVVVVVVVCHYDDLSEPHDSAPCHIWPFWAYPRLYIFT